MANKSMVAVGHDENVYTFSAIGIDAIVATPQNIKDIILDKIASDKKIFLVSQVFSEIVNEIREDYLEQTYPIFLFISMDPKVPSIGVKEIQKNVEKATGINLL